MNAQILNTNIILQLIRTRVVDAISSSQQEQHIISTRILIVACVQLAEQTCQF